MSYLKALLKYYDCFSAIDFDKYSNRIYFSGKFNFKLIFIWLLISIWPIMMALLPSIIDNNIKEKYITITIAIVAIILVFLRSNLVFRKLEHKPLNINLYNRELPSNLRPAQVRMLLHDGLIDKKSLAGTLLDLIDRRYLNISRTSQKTVGLEEIFKKDSDIIIFRTDKPIYSLLRYEKFFIKWFIEKYGDGQEVRASEISKALNNDIYSEQPHNLFQCWQGLVLLSFPFEKFYKKTINKKIRIIYLIMTFVGFLVMSSKICMLIGIYGLGCLLFAAPLCVLNEKGIEEKDNWLDLKRYLIDFSNIKEKSIEEITLWQFYLTYSIVLDIKSEASKEIGSFFGKKIYSVFEDFRTYRETNKNTKPENVIAEYVNGNNKENIKRQIEIEIAKLDIK